MVCGESAFGNGAAAGPTNVLYLAAGPNDEKAGLFGRIDAQEGGGAPLR